MNPRLIAAAEKWHVDIARNMPIGDGECRRVWRTEFEITHDVRAKLPADGWANMRRMD